jgi:hypothetical protein
MPTFFTGGAVGRVVQLEDDHTQGTVRFVSMTDEIRHRQHRSIITRLTVSHQCNYQFLHTIGNEIYIYVFGDRIGQVTLSGLSFAAECNPCATGPQDSKHGFEKVLAWYEEYRVAARRDPIEVLIGETPIKAFVVALSGDVVDPSTRMMQWNLTCMILPKKGGNNGGGGGGGGGGNVAP